MLRTLNNALILVTGASEGIGAEIARQAVAAGARVVLVARNADKLRQVALRLTGKHKPEFFAVDLSDAEARSAFLAHLEAQNLFPDVVINNAGLGASGTYSDESWDKIDAMLRVNMIALAHITHWAARVMKRNGHGAIVNISSAVATRPTPYFAAYAASKAFVTSLSQALHAELKKYGISVSAIHPPAVKTNFANPEKADLKETLVLKLFPAVSPISVARAALKASQTGKRSAVIGPIAAIIMATAVFMPRSLDLAFMGMMFKHPAKRKGG